MLLNCIQLAEQGCIWQTGKKLNPFKALAALPVSAEGKSDAGNNC